MQLTAIIDDRRHPIEVPEALLAEAEGFFAKLDTDMAQGWQMSRRWVESPDTLERCQIVADRLRSAIDGNNAELQLLLAGYIMSRAPGALEVHIDTTGDMAETRLVQG